MSEEKKEGGMSMAGIALVVVIIVILGFWLMRSKGPMPSEPYMEAAAAPAEDGGMVTEQDRAVIDATRNAPPSAE